MTCLRQQESVWIDVERADYSSLAVRASPVQLTPGCLSQWPGRLCGNKDLAEDVRERARIRVSGTEMCRRLDPGQAVGISYSGSVVEVR